MVWNQDETGLGTRRYSKGTPVTCEGINIRPGLLDTSEQKDREHFGMWTGYHAGLQIICNQEDR